MSPTPRGVSKRGLSLTDPVLHRRSSPMPRSAATATALRAGRPAGESARTRQSAIGAASFQLAARANSPGRAAVPNMSFRHASHVSSAMGLSWTPPFR